VNVNERDICVVIPAFNEEKSIGSTVKALLKLPLFKRILVVDDGSSDNTAKAASEAGAEVITLPANKGKAYAMKKGYEAVKEGIIVFLDADLGDSAEQALRLVEPVINGDAEAAVARFPMTPGSGGFGLVKLLAAKGIQILTGKRFSSILSGQRAFLHSVLRPEFFDYRGFGIEFGMTADLLSINVRIQEVDVNMKHRTTGRDIKGFLHRYRQFKDILNVFIRKLATKPYIRHPYRYIKEQD